MNDRRTEGYIVLFSLTGRMYVWGRYRNTYVVYDKDGNVDMCSFDVFVRSEYKPSVLHIYAESEYNSGVALRRP